MRLENAVAQRLKELMSQKGITGAEIAEKSGVPASTVNEILEAGAKETEIDTLFQILKVLKVELVEFFANDIFDPKNLETTGIKG